ncbi:MAG: hypothetical protein ABI980_05045 [Nitrospirota bacterium]
MGRATDATGGMMPGRRKLVRVVVGVVIIGLAYYVIMRMALYVIFRY